VVIFINHLPALAGLESQDGFLGKPESGEEGNPLDGLLR